METLTRAVLVAVLAACAVGYVVPTAQAASNDCRYYYSSRGHGPNGETTGHGDYREGVTGPEGLVCRGGFWAYRMQDRPQARPVNQTQTQARPVNQTQTQVQPVDHSQTQVQPVDRDQAGDDSGVDGLDWLWLPRALRGPAAGAPVRPTATPPPSDCVPTSPGRAAHFG